MTEKYCWLCKHIVVDSGWGGTDITPGSPSELQCNRGHWNLFDGGMYSGSAELLRKCLEQADTCPDLELGDWVEDQSK